MEKRIFPSTGGKDPMFTVVHPESKIFQNNTNSRTIYLNLSWFKLNGCLNNIKSGSDVFHVNRKKNAKENERF